MTYTIRQEGTLWLVIWHTPLMKHEETKVAQYAYRANAEKKRDELNNRWN